MLSPFFEKIGGMTDFTIEDCDGKAMRMWVKDREELVGKRLRQLMNDDNLKTVKLFIHDALNDGFAEKEFLIYRSGPRKKYWFQARAVRANLGLAVTLRDITEVKEKEK